MVVQLNLDNEMIALSFSSLKWSYYFYDSDAHLELRKIDKNASNKNCYANLKALVNKIYIIFILTNHFIFLISKTEYNNSFLFNYM